MNLQNRQGGQDLQPAVLKKSKHSRIRTLMQEVATSPIGEGKSQSFKDIRDPISRAYIRSRAMRN